MTEARSDEGTEGHGGGPGGPPSTPRSVAVLTGALASAAVGTGLWAGAIGGSALDLPVPVALALLGALTIAGCLQIRFSYREELEALDLFDAMLSVVLFALAGPLVVVFAAAAKGVSQAYLRVAPVKACFNVAQWAAAAGVGSLVYQRLRSGEAFSTRNILTLAVAMVAVALVNHFAVVLVLSLVSPEGFARVFGHLLGGMGVPWLAAGAANLAFGVLLVAALHSGAWATFLFLVPLGMLHWANRGFAEGRADRVRLSGLQRATHALAAPIDPRDAIGDFLAELRSCFEVEVAEAVLVTEGGYRVHRVGGSGPGEVRTWLDRAGSETLAAALLEHGGTLRVGPGATGVLGERRQREGWRDCMAAPIQSGGDARGVLCTYNRTGLEGFERGEIAVLQALAGELAGALDKALLVEEALRQAAHDSLTGLPNRTLFSQRLEEALARNPPGGGGTAVMLVDLDRFKEVNDTLGHHCGDVLLQEVSGRLKDVLRPYDTVARLGGDEFAVVLPDVAGAAVAVVVAQRVLRALDEPFVVGDLALDIDASIGIALSPDHGEEAATLLQRADVAMYTAKAAQTGYQLYSPAADPYSARRLALGRELRCAVDNDELRVHYQPKADLETGRITGVEALVRWDHPQHGFVPPDEFIPLAERTGTIRALTLYVLAAALEQCRAWRRRGVDLDVAVNLSVRSLHDDELPDDVARLLAASGVPAAHLTLEITETSVMVDSNRSMSVLSRLHALGVSLSIDDFGTGQSSLAYLKKLPVDEVKIDRSFVTNMARDENDAVIVRSTVDLGHNLGLRVVAEGVEDAASWNQLIEFGCDVAQGYFCSRPVPAAEVEEIIAARGQRTACRRRSRLGHGLGVRTTPVP